MIHIFSIIRYAVALFFSVPLLLSLSACQSVSPDKSVKIEDDNSQAQAIQVVRYGRYTLVELTPEAAQSDLMTQVVDVSIPLSQGMAEISVGEAMRYVLQRSGYRLCEPSTAFDLLPLPVAHAHLGPMQLRDALAVLAGPAWTLQIDDKARQVCFIADSDKAQKQEVSQ